MRYILQVVVMLGDIALWAAVAVVLATWPLNPIMWLICLMAIRSWRDHGGWEAWRPSTVRRFMANAKDMGL